MPLYVAEIYNIEDAANSRKVEQIDQYQYDDWFPGTTTSSTPRFFYKFAKFGTQAHPGSYTVEFTSSLTTDTGQLRLTGFDASDNLATETITINGTTTVTSPITYKTIEQINKITNSALKLEGDITIKKTAIGAFTAVASTDIITLASHGLSNGNVIVLTTTTTLPAGLSLATTYFVISATTNTFQLAATLGGAAIDITDTGTGTHSATVNPITIAVIPTWVKSPQYQWIEFYPIPDAAITYTVRAEMFKPDLVNDYDWPALEDKYHDLILLDAGTELLPIFGKGDIALDFERKFGRRLKEAKRSQNRTHRKDRQFSDVQIGDHALPYRPLIRNVDII